MMRTIVPLLIGISIGLVGIGFTEESWRNRGSKPELLLTVASGATDPDRSRRERSAESSAVQYLDAYSDAAQLANAVAIETRLRELFGEPFSVRRDAQISALFERLAALDLRRAMRLAEAPGFDLRLTSRMLRALVRQDPEAAIELLSEIRGRGLQVDLAIVVLQELGHSESNLALVASALPESLHVSLQIEALGALASAEPDRAMRVAMELSDSGVRNAAVQRIGIEWAREDPAGAYAMSESLPGELTEAYRDAVSVEWARLDSESFLAFVDTRSTLRDVLHGVMHTIGVAPALTFEIAQGLPPERVTGNFPAYYTVQRVSFANAATADPEGYLAMVESLPEGQQKNQLIQAMAEVLGRTQPEEGIAWARARNDPQAEALVAQQALNVSFDLSLRLMVEFNERHNRPGMLASIGTAMGAAMAGRADPAEMAAKLLDEPDQESASIVLNQMLRQWAETDPEDAFEWMLAEGRDIDSGIASVIAGRLAHRDASRASTYLDRVPSELRQVWLQQVAPAYASQDPDAAASWLTQFRGEPGYDDVYRRVVQEMAQADPYGAASMLASAPAQLQQEMAASVVNGFAQQSFHDAGRWVIGLADEAARGAATSQLVSSWSYRDPGTAQRWAVDLPPGELRDRALSTALARLSRGGFHTTIDHEVFEAFDSDRVRDQQIEMLISNVAPVDPEYARSILDEWVADPGVRARIEQSF